MNMPTPRNIDPPSSPPSTDPPEPVFFATLRQFYAYHDALVYTLDMSLGTAFYCSLATARPELAEGMLADSYDPRGVTSTRDPLYIDALYYLESHWYQPLPGAVARARLNEETEELLDSLLDDEEHAPTPPPMTPEEHALWTAVYTTVLAPQLEDTRSGSVDEICAARANSAVRKLRAAAELLKGAR